MAPQPVVSFLNGLSQQAFLGADQTLTLRFDNAASGAGTGYAPYIDLILPANGADGAGAGNAPVNDGVSFVSATYLGASLQAKTIEFDATGRATHPFAKDALGNPVVVTGTPGDTLLVLTLPFGSFTTTQTPADIALTLHVSDLADPGTLLGVTVKGGFAYGADPFNNPSADPVITGPAAVTAIDPVVAKLSVTYGGPEQETATGPSYPREWVVKGLLASGQPFTNFTLSDTTPDGVVVTGAHLELNGVTIAAPVSIVRNADGTTSLTGTFPGTIAGGSQVPTMVIDWYATEFLHDGTPVLDPSTGSFRPLLDNARLEADWTPVDARDANPTHIDLNPSGAENIVTAKSIAIQKSVALISGDADQNGVPDWQSHGTLAYTLNGQVSNYFELGGLVVKDRLGDGQTFDAGFAPTVIIREGGQTVYQGPVAYTLGAKAADGTTAIQFDISQTMANAGLDPVLDGNGGGVSQAAHATDYRQATIQVTFHTTLDATWTGSVPGDPLVDQGDTVRNDVLYDGTVVPTGNTAEDDSQAGVTLPVNNVSKSIYAVNGDTTKGTTSFATPAKVQSGDLITFRLGLDIPLTSSHVVSLKDYLPLPVLKAVDPDADGTASGYSFLGNFNPSGLAAGTVMFGPTDSFHTQVPGVTPRVLADANGNSLTLDFGGATNALYPATHLDLLVTLRVNDQAFGDGLLLTNQVTASEANSQLHGAEDNAIIQFVLGEPVLKVTKGIIGVDNPAATFLNATTQDATIGPVGFTAPGSAGPRFSGTIDSTSLAAKPVDANITFADAGDRVSFAIIVENRGQGWKGAFDTLVHDTLPSGFVIPPGGLNLQVTDGTGTALSATGNLFGAGLEITDGANKGGIGAHDPTSGRNIAVITYDLVLANALATPQQALTNTAAVTHYAAQEGGIDRTPYDTLPLSDTASATVLPTIAKMVSATSLAATTRAQGDATINDLAIGETVTYTITLRMPEGVMSQVRLEDLLPTLGGQIKAISASVTGIGTNVSGTKLALNQAAALGDGNGDGVADTLSLDFGTVTNAVDNANDTKDTITVQVVGQLTKNVANAAGDVLVNTARVSAADPNSPGSRISQEATAKIEVVEPHLAITKTVSQATADAGDVLTYTVTLTNQVKGFDAPAFDVSITDLLNQIGPNASYVAGSAKITAGAAAIASGNGAGDTSLLVTAAALNPGQTITVQFQARVGDAATSGRTFTNTASATGSSLPGTDAEERASPVSASASVGIGASTITKAVTATSYADTGASRGTITDQDVKVGETITYTITLTLPEGESVNYRVIDQLADSLVTGNNGGQLLYVPNSAKVVGIGANLYTDAAFTTRLSGATTTATNGAGSGDPASADTVTWAFGTVYNKADNTVGDADRIVLQIQAVASGVAANQTGDRLVNTARALSDFTATQTATATVDFVQPLLAVTKTASATTGDAGNVITYTLTIRHASGSTADAYDVDLADILQPGLAYVTGSLTSSAGSASVANGTLNFHMDQLALGSGTVQLTYKAVLLDTVVNGLTIPNTAALDYQTSSPAQDPTGGRNITTSAAAPVTVTITDAVAKTIAGTDNPYTTGSNLAVGETVTYLLTATLGEGTQHLILKDALPAGLTYVSSQVTAVNGITGSVLAIGDAGSLSNGALTFDFGNIVNPGDNNAATGSVQVQVVAKVAAGTAAATVLTNTATLAPLAGANPYGINPNTALPVKTANVASTVVAASIGDKIFEDLNANGVQDSGEPGLAGVKVDLYNAANQLVATTTTTGTGAYSFGNLVPGQYREVFTAPATGTWFVSPQGKGTAATDSGPDAAGNGPVITLMDGQTDTTHDAGFYRKVTLGDRAFVDANGNGVQDGGEAGLSGVTVQLLDASGAAIAGKTVLTDANGLYSFTGLMPGSYGVQFAASNGSLYVLTGKDLGGNDAADSDADPLNAGRTDTLLYNSGAAETSRDAGFYVPAKLGDLAWVDANGNGVQDSGEQGLAGVTVKLYAWGTTTLVASTTTDGNGTYGFTGLRPGDYYETFTAPGGYVLTKAGAGTAATDSDPVDAGTASGMGPKITLASGDNDTTHDAGFYAPVTIGDKVFYDINGNGVQEAGEAGIGGVGVTLLNGSGQALTSTTTNADGLYSFGSLAPGDYAIRFATPSGHSVATADAGGDDGRDSDIDAAGTTPVKAYASGASDSSVDAGYWKPASIGNKVFLDANGNGLQDIGEAGIDGIAVQLFRAGILAGSTVTGNGGAYSFGNLIPGTYQVKFVTSGGHVLTAADKGGDDTRDSDADPATGLTAAYTLVADQANLTVDAGMYKPVTIGDLAFEDRNGNGVRDAGEDGVSGVGVTLVNDLTGQTTTTATGADGSYSFAGLPPGTYHEEFTRPAGWVFTPSGAGTAATDSDPNPATGIAAAFSITSGQSDVTRDVGLYRPITIGDTVFTDMNANGVQDAGDRPLAGVTVRLLDANGNPISGQTAVTDGSGHYQFGGLAPGQYGVQFTRPAGTVASPQDATGDAADSDADAATGKTAIRTYISGDNDGSVDAGFYMPTGLGDRVFLDANGNGLQDAGETGIDGVAVTLLDGSGAPLPGRVTNTSGGGFYQFAGLVPGEYKVQFSAPAGYAVTLRDQGGSDAADSDASPLTGITGTYTLVSGQTATGVDTGLYQPVTIGDRVWVDANGNGVQDSGEQGLAGVTVTLVNELTGEAITQTTDASGNYLFTGLRPGNYHEIFSAPTGYVVTRAGAGTGATDSDPDGGGFGESFFLGSGGSSLTHDAGLYIPPKIGGTVSLDLPPGICDYKRPDAVFAGVTVELRDAVGHVVRTMTTGSDGTYLFENLVPGTYSVAFVAPPGTHFTKGVPESGLGGSIATVSGDAFTHIDAALSHLTGTIFDQPPTVLTSPWAYDANTAVNIAFEGAGQTNLNAPGSYVVGGHGGLTASSNQAGQYIIGGAGDNLLHGGSNGATLGGSVLVGGAGNNVFEATSGNDIVLGGCGTNNMQGLGTVDASAPRGLAGFDILVGGLSADVIEGNNSTAVMIGGGGDDQIHGDGTIIGGTNDGTISHADGVFSNFRIGDHLKGGGAANTFVYQKGDGVQWIENYHPGQGDSLQIYGYAAPTATGTVNGFTVLYFGPNDALVFNSVAPTENITYFAHQDSAPGAYGHWAPLPPTLLATAVTAYAGTQGDDIAVGSSAGTSFHGGGGDNLLIGGAGNDTFHGGAGNTTFIGNGGTDLYIGGTGNDLYHLNAAGEAIVEQVNGGQDMVVSGFSITLATNVENLILTRGAGNLAGTGNAAGNTLVGNEGGNVLRGMAGNDTLQGHAGSDWLQGGEGDDSLEGGIGTDQLSGGTGNDRLNGASGQGDADILIGGAGDDTYIVDSASDLISEAAGGGIDTVIAAFTAPAYALGAELENLVLGGAVRTGNGNALDNRITGNALSNWLVGQAGSDTLEGLGGGDVLHGGSGADSFVFGRGTGQDLVGDFTAGEDRLLLEGLGFSSFADVQAHMTEVSGSTVIDLGQGDGIRLHGVANAALTTADFLYA
ncbi:carboxypeptidase regulatory-like domain-containing protein [Belnapia sp. T18]|uniref:Carboxypeptidase regulatory-like domain-containing protein n=1 Tax=Belnapia arida TaxID=2804533 RepID=A0ABS1TWF6_9PROT|nr:SdrD B-like domain-containing protein [Belnapia arida]MBL6076709.1 carboxypeptidase regulatory-like domain-containing protein [Belnapia arida]